MNTPKRKGRQASHNEELALQLAEMGIPILPLRREAETLKDGQTRPPNTPHIRDWPEKATTDPDQIRFWFRKWPGLVPGMLTGRRSGIAVLDLDRKNGKDGFSEVTQLGLNPHALSPIQVETPSDGLHSLQEYPADGLKTTAGQVAPGVDTKGDGGYVVAPGAETAKGVYRFVRGDLDALRAIRDLAALPSWPDAARPPRRSSDPGEAQPSGLPFDVIADALSYLPNDGDEFGSRDDWLRIGAATHAETGGSEDGREAFHDFSAKWPGYDPDATDAAYDSFTADAEGGVTGWTIFHEARKRGWHNDEAETFFLSQRRDRDRLLLDGCWSDEELGVAKAEALSDEGKALIWGPKSHLTFYSPRDCVEMPSRRYVLKGLVAEGDMAAIVGQPSAGKSLIGPYLGYRVAQGKECFGRRTRQGKVFYVAAEDPSGIQMRVQALRAELGEADDFKVVGGVSDLLSKHSKDRDALIAAVKAEKPSLVVIDTVSVAFPGLEENDAKGMGTVVTVARALTKWGAAVILIHHDAKDSTNGLARGHSILNGALDMSLHLKRNNRTVIGRPTKNRNGTTDQELAFEAVEIHLGEDDDGEPITTARCEEIVGPVAKPGKPLPASVKAAFDILEELMRGRQSVGREEWRTACLASDSVSAAEKTDDRGKAFRRALEHLARRKLFTSQGDRIRLTQFPEMLLGDGDV